MEQNKKIKLIAIAGPTASGKSALAVELAHILDGEVVSCDSMQIYRGMDIGTAKPTASEMEGVPHHMIDVADPYDPEGYSCAKYAEQASAAIAAISARGKLPIVCGGTGMYLDTLLMGTSLGDAPSDPEVRRELSELDPDELYAELCAVDPEAAAAIHKNNVKRVSRAVEIYRVSGITKTEWDRRSKAGNSPYDFCAIALGMQDREVLYERIRRRVDRMIEDGLCDEVRRLSLPENTTAGAAIGYKELNGYLRGEMSLDAAVTAIKDATQRYAKRQQTWFRHRSYLNWLICCDRCGVTSENFKQIVNISLELLKCSGNML